METSGRTLFIATTNFPWDLEPVILRRFEMGLKRLISLDLRKKFIFLFQVLKVEED